MAGGRPGGQQDLTAAQRNRRERDALVAQYGENSPQVYAFDMYVRSPKITDIGGVPTMFGAGGDRPLSTFEDEMRAAEDLARARAEGTNSVVPAKDRVDIFRKYPRMQAARRDLQNALDASFALDRRNFGKGGPMQGWLQITREGQQFQQAVEAMFSHIQALIRVPGVGAQSDWEGRIAQAPLPNLNMYPETRAQAFQTYFDLIDDLEAALAAVGGGDTSALTVTPEPITPPSEYTNTIRYDAQGNRIR